MANICMQQEPCKVFFMFSAAAPHPISRLLSLLRLLSSPPPSSSTLLSSFLLILFFFSLPPPSNLATLSSHPSVLLCCFLPAHYPSPPLRCPPVCAVEYFPSLPLAFSLYPFPFRYCRYYLFSPVCLIILFPFFWQQISLTQSPFFLIRTPLPQRLLRITFTSALHCFNSIFFVILSLSFNLSSISRRYASICPITASLTLCLPLLLSCLWPSALCTSNGWGVIHWLIC